jgi:capsular exopolysaccharide synthesis family protein
MFIANRNEFQPKIILVTSAIPKEGKTTVVSNLGRALAAAQSRVLLIDADFRRGSLHNVFGLGLKPGLLEVLNQSISPAQAIVSTGHPGLFLLPAGESGSGTSDAFVYNPLHLLLNEIAAQYNYIIIDSAPVLATDEAASLGPHTDGVCMVVRASYTSATATREALGRLRRRKVKVLGMIYNYTSASSDYYHRYSRRYSNRSGRLTS